MLYLTIYILSVNVGYFWLFGAVLDYLMGYFRHISVISQNEVQNPNDAHNLGHSAYSSYWFGILFGRVGAVKSIRVCLKNLHLMNNNTNLRKKKNIFLGLAMQPWFQLLMMETPL